MWLLLIDPTVLVPDPFVSRDLLLQQPGLSKREKRPWNTAQYVVATGTTVCTLEGICTDKDMFFTASLVLIHHLQYSCTTSIFEAYLATVAIVTAIQTHV